MFFVGAEYVIEISAAKNETPQHQNEHVYHGDHFPPIVFGGYKLPFDLVNQQNTHSLCHEDKKTKKAEHCRLNETVTDRKSVV